MVHEAKRKYSPSEERDRAWTRVQRWPGLRREPRETWYVLAGACPAGERTLTIGLAELETLLGHDGRPVSSSSCYRRLDALARAGLVKWRRKDFLIRVRFYDPLALPAPDKPVRLVRGGAAPPRCAPGQRSLLRPDLGVFDPGEEGKEADPDPLPDPDLDPDPLPVSAPADTSSLEEEKINQEKTSSSSSIDDDEFWNSVIQKRRELCHTLKRRPTKLRDLRFTAQVAALRLDPEHRDWIGQAVAVVAEAAEIRNPLAYLHAILPDFAPMGSEVRRLLAAMRIPPRLLVEACPNGDQRQRE